MTILSRAAGTPNLVRLVAAFEQRGARVTVARPAGWMGASHGEPAGPSTGASSGVPAGAPAIAVTRLASGTPSWETAALDARWPGPWLNSPSALRATHDKLATQLHLARAGLPGVPTYAVLRDEPGPAPRELSGTWWVVKPPTGLGGRGVVPRLAPEQALARARAYADLCGLALLQPWLGAGLDRRVFLVGGHVAAGMRRVPLRLDGRGNVTQGARALPWEPDPASVDLARAAAACLGLDVAGVDLLEHEGRWVVLEVNACPGLSAIEAATGRDVAGAMAELAMARAQGV